ncbi:MAG: FliG C-terminal domain-containing protein [Pseudomonadota bacterium]
MTAANLPARIEPATPPALALSALDGAQKAAVVLVALGPEAAAEILRGLGEGHVRRFASAVSRMSEVPRQQVDAVVGEFLDALNDTLSVRGGAAEARKFLGHVMNEDDVAQVMDEIETPTQRSIWRRLAGAADAPLAAWLASEHPQVVSVVLARLRSDQAARLLERFETVFAHEVVLRMARAPNPDAAADAVLKTIVERDFVSVMERNHGARKPAELIAALLNHVSRASRDSMLEKMEADDPKLALEVQRVMFTFADIASRVPPRDIAALVKAVDEMELLTALKSAAATDDPAVEFILGNVTRRLADRLRDDLESLPDVSAKEGEAAQTAVVNVIQQMVRRGEIKLIELDSTED